MEMQRNMSRDSSSSEYADASLAFGDV